MFGSCKLAYEDFKEETALLYLHLNKTKQFHRTLTLIDKLGISHQLDLDSLEFVLQKKADLVYPTLKQLIQTNQIETAKKHLDAILELISTRLTKGIADSDAIIERNFGFICEKAISIDIGCFTKDESLKLPALFQEEMRFETGALYHWLKKRSPELAAYFKKKRQIAEVR